MTIDFEDATNACSVAENTVVHWAQTTLISESNQDTMLAIRVVDAAEGQQLNDTFRGKNYATNVLSFPADIQLPEGPVILGDIAICLPVVIQEASDQGKSFEQHLAHMVIHGCLHLLGFDHENDEDALEMEMKEIGILQNLGYPNPYVSQELKST